MHGRINSRNKIAHPLEIFRDRGQLGAVAGSQGVDVGRLNVEDHGDEVFIGLIEITPDYQGLSALRPAPVPTSAASR